MWPQADRWTGSWGRGDPLAAASGSRGPAKVCPQDGETRPPLQAPHAWPASLRVASAPASRVRRSSGQSRVAGGVIFHVTDEEAEAQGGSAISAYAWEEAALGHKPRAPGAHPRPPGGPAARPGGGGGAPSPSARGGRRCSSSLRIMTDIFGCFLLVRYILGTLP